MTRTKQPKEQIEFPAALDEGIQGEDLVRSQELFKSNMFISLAAHDEDQHKRASGGKLSPTISTRSPSANDGSQSGRSSEMDEEERVAEKARLQAMVKSFSREAISGVQFKMVRSPRGTTAVSPYVSAKFFLDRQLAIMTVQGGGQTAGHHDMTGGWKRIPLIDVMEAYSYDDLMKDDPESQCGKDLRHEDRSSAIFIQHKAPGLPVQWLCLVAADEEAQERFVTCIKILQFYSVQQNARV
jgi:hypothetical protein